jgi:hypothetical protein
VPFMFYVSSYFFPYRTQRGHHIADTRLLHLIKYLAIQSDVLPSVLPSPRSRFLPFFSLPPPVFSLFPPLASRISDVAASYFFFSLPLRYLIRRTQLAIRRYIGNYVAAHLSRFCTCNARAAFSFLRRAEIKTRYSSPGGDRRVASSRRGNVTSYTTPRREEPLRA